MATKLCQKITDDDDDTFIGVKGQQRSHIAKCDMIKGNESDVRNIDFELQAKRSDKFLFLHCFELHRIAHISPTRYSIEMGFGSKCSNLKGQVIYIEKSKLNIADM